MKRICVLLSFVPIFILIYSSSSLQAHYVTVMIRPAIADLFKDESVDDVLTKCYTLFVSDIRAYDPYDEENNDDEHCNVYKKYFLSRKNDFVLDVRTLERTVLKKITLFDLRKEVFRHVAQYFHPEFLWLYSLELKENKDDKALDDDCIVDTLGSKNLIMTFEANHIRAQALFGKVIDYYRKRKEESLQYWEKLYQDNGRTERNYLRTLIENNDLQKYSIILTFSPTKL